MDCEMTGGMQECEFLIFEKETNSYTCEHFDGKECRNGELIQARVDELLQAQTEDEDR